MRAALALVLVLFATGTARAQPYPQAEAQALALARETIALRSVQGPDNRTIDVARVYARALREAGWAAVSDELVNSPSRTIVSDARTDLLHVPHAPLSRSCQTGTELQRHTAGNAC